MKQFVQSRKFQTIPNWYNTDKGWGVDFSNWWNSPKHYERFKITSHYCLIYESFKYSKYLSEHCNFISHFHSCGRNNFLCMADL